MKIVLFSFSVALLIVPFHPKAQMLEIKGLEFKANKIIVHYDLLDSVEDRSYTIRVYASVDGYVNPLQKITGDVGLDVSTGKNKRIEWAVLEEAYFEENLAIEIKGRVFVPFINAEGINQYKVFKRARTYNLTCLLISEYWKCRTSFASVSKSY